MARFTNLQREFINQYFLNGRNATQAAIDAGYDIKDPDSKRGRQVAAAIGYENLKKPHIRDEIARRLDEYALSANEVLAVLSDHARGSMVDFISFSPAGYPKLDLQKASDRGVLHLLKKFEVIQGEHGPSVKIELHDAQSAAVQLGRYHKLFTDKVEVTDWRSEVEEAGIDAEAVFDEIVARFANQ